MTNEPVAYYKDFSDGTRLFFKSNELCDIDNSDNLIKPLYTKEQLQPRVKMTQAEFDEFEKLSKLGVDTIYDALDLVNSDRGETDEFENIYNRLFGGDNFIKIQKNQLEFSNLWAYYNPEEPDVMIEIIPDKKWFVISKDLDDGIYYVMGVIDERYPAFNSALNELEVAKFGHEFDTKEQAEEWTNPLTKAVLLPVEEN